MPALVRQQAPVRKRRRHGFARLFFWLDFAFISNYNCLIKIARKPATGLTFALLSLVCYINALDDIFTRSNELWRKNQP